MPAVAAPRAAASGPSRDAATNGHAAVRPNTRTRNSSAASSPTRLAMLLTCNPVASAIEFRGTRAASRAGSLPRLAAATVVAAARFDGSAHGVVVDSVNVSDLL